jgi:hypothetical protein
MRHYVCPFHGCGRYWDSLRSLYGHMSRKHLVASKCSSCGTPFTSMTAFYEHFKSNCKKRDRSEKRLRESVAVAQEVHDVAPMAADVSPEPDYVANAFERAENGDPVFIPNVMEQAAGGGTLFHLEEGMQSQDLLDLFVADCNQSSISLEDRFISKESLEAEFRVWWSQQDVLARQCESKESKSPIRQFASIISGGAVSASVQEKLFRWLQNDLGPELPQSLADDIPDKFARFKELCEERADLVVETVISHTPKAMFFHIPLLLSGVGLLQNSHTVVNFNERREINPRSGESERCWKHFWDGDKFKQIAQQVRQQNLLPAVWSLFLDKTRLVKWGNRRGYVVLACPLNNPFSQFDIVGFIPTLEDCNAELAGISKRNSVLFRYHLQQQALRVVLLYGGFRLDSPSFLVKTRGGATVKGRNILGCVRVDGEELCHVVCRNIAASAKHCKHLACYRHKITSDKLSEPVLDPDVHHTLYSHNSAYVTIFDNLLRDWKEGGRKRKSAKDQFRALGLHPVRPALLDAYLFDCARDVVGDIHHVGPHGIGLFMLEQLCDVLRSFLPEEDGIGKMRQDFIDDHFEVHKDEIVIMPLNCPAKVNGKLYIEPCNLVPKRQFYVPDKYVHIQKDFNNNYLRVIREIDTGLAKMGSSYTRSYKRFDFVSLEEASNKGSAVFGRATTVEMVLLFMAPLLAVALRDIPGSDWVVQSFHLYNKFYWSWRRDVFFATDGGEMEQIRFEFKSLLV